MIAGSGESVAATAAFAVSRANGMSRTSTDLSSSTNHAISFRAAASPFEASASSLPRA
jgi:hypothetical protein